MALLKIRILGFFVRMGGSCCISYFSETYICDVAAGRETKDKENTSYFTIFILQKPQVFTGRFFKKT